MLTQDAKRNLLVHHFEPALNVSSHKMLLIICSPNIMHDNHCAAPLSHSLAAVLH